MLGELGGYVRMTIHPQPSLSRLDAVLHGYQEQMERDLIGLLAIPSVEGAAAPGAPFGPAVAEALAYTLAVAESLGFSTHNLDGYLGWADLPGQEGEQVGVLGHLDVVPAEAAAWTSPPFTPTIRQGRLYARGAEDDKGPLLAALYAAAAVAELGWPRRRTVRFLFGCNEETGMACIDHYLAQQAPPAVSFTPDGCFPLIVGEKGLLHFTLEQQWQQAASDLLSVEAGLAANIVPDQAQAVLQGLDPACFAALPTNISLDCRDGRLLLTAHGRSAHASLPEEGENALAALVTYLAALPLAPSPAREYVRALARLFADDKHGRGLGLAEANAQGRLTCVPSCLHLDGAGAQQWVDIRFLYHRQVAEYAQALRELAAREGFTIGQWLAQEPLSREADSPEAQCLLDAYRQVTGDLSQPLWIGGGTYAKKIPGCMAFGPELPGQPSMCHQTDEYISLEHLRQLSRIYARAIYGLAK